MHAGRDMDQQLVVHRPGLDDQHRVFAALAQAVGEHAAGRAGAEDDVVVFELHRDSIATVAPEVNRVGALGTIAAIAYHRAMPESANPAAEVFDFDREIDRRGTDSAKWDKYVDRDILPMWVADTDFATHPAIVAALRARLEHPSSTCPASSARCISPAARSAKPATRSSCRA